MPYVERDAGGLVKGVYANLQEGYAEEWLEDHATDVVAFLTPPITAEQVVAEAQHRILNASADARANQIFGESIPAEVVALCTAIRTKGEEIAAMSPIPEDFASDSWWT
jgi:hypothetical protein